MEGHLKYCAIYNSTYSRRIHLTLPKCLSSRQKLFRNCMVSQISCFICPKVSGREHDHWHRYDLSLRHHWENKFDWGPRIISTKRWNQNTPQQYIIRHQDIKWHQQPLQYKYWFSRRWWSKWMFLHHIPWKPLSTLPE